MSNLTSVRCRIAVARFHLDTVDELGDLRPDGRVANSHVAKDLDVEPQRGAVAKGRRAQPDHAELGALLFGRCSARPCNALTHSLAKRL